jgi:hypothetical protein
VRVKFCTVLGFVGQLQNSLWFGSFRGRVRLEHGSRSLREVEGWDVILVLLVEECAKPIAGQRKAGWWNDGLR